jgi:predicted DNA-binding ArsR family transcriptional regulator
VATNLENHGKGKNSSRNLEIMENWTLIMEKWNFLENHGTFFEKPGKSSPHFGHLKL